MEEAHPITVMLFLKLGCQNLCPLLYRYPGIVIVVFKMGQITIKRSQTGTDGMYELFTDTDTDTDG